MYAQKTIRFDFLIDSAQYFANQHVIKLIINSTVCNKDL